MGNFQKLGLLVLAGMTWTPSAFAQAALTQDQIAAIAQIPAVNVAIEDCSADRWRFCGGVFPGGGRILRCLAANADRLSPQCKSALIGARNAIAVSGILNPSQ
jgi:hypothetical protein